MALPAFSRSGRNCTLAAALVLSVSAGALLAAPPSSASSTPQGAAITPTSDSTSASQTTPRLLRVDANATLTTVRALGDAKQAAADQARPLAHSDLQGTGRFVEAGQRVTVTVPAGVTGLEVAIGLHGNHWDINDCHDVGMHVVALQPGVNQITAPHAGLVSLQNRTHDDVSAPIVVTGGKPVPTFVAGQTTRADFDSQLARWDAPVFSLVGQRVQADFQRAGEFSGKPFDNEATLAALDLDERIGAWDEGVRANDRFSGLTAEQAVHPVQISGASHTGVAGGGPAVAKDGVIVSPSADASHSQLLDASATNSALWTAIGQTYRSDLLAWSDGDANLTKIVDRLARAHQAPAAFNGFAAAYHQQQITNLRGERFGTYKDFDTWIQSSMGQNSGGLVFEQLNWAFGDDFVTDLIREHRADGGGTRTADQFALAAATAADRDLAPYFAAWEIPLTATTKATMAELPALDSDIWKVYQAD